MKELLRKWQSFAHPATAYEPVDSKLRKTKSSTWDPEGPEKPEAEEEASGGSVSHSENSSATTCDDVPEGHLVVYVGRERRRFIIDAHYLNNTLVRGLIEKSGEECGPDRPADDLTIACEVVLFEHLLWLIGNDDPNTRQTEVDELIDYYKY